MCYSDKQKAWENILLAGLSYQKYQMHFFRMKAIENKIRYDMKERVPVKKVIPVTTKESMMIHFFFF